LKASFDCIWHRISVKSLEEFGFLWYLSVVPGEVMHRALPGKYTAHFIAPFWSTNATRETPCRDFRTHFCPHAVYRVSSRMPVRACIFSLTGLYCALASDLIDFSGVTAVKHKHWIWLWIPERSVLSHLLAH